MSDITISTHPLPSPLQPASVDKPRRITGRLKRALDAMVWDNLTDNEAAVQTGMTVTNIRIALRLPHARAYYHAQLQVLRSRESSRNIHTLIDVRDQLTNQMARVNAVKALEQLDDTPERGAARASSPGMVVVIQAPAAIRDVRTIEGTTASVQQPPNEPD